jgi:hypothetical protein
MHGFLVHQELDDRVTYINQNSEQAAAAEHELHIDQF